MRGLFNLLLRVHLADLRLCFNPPCGCVAFSTDHGGASILRVSVVSIRLADAWPFQLDAARYHLDRWRDVSIRLADAWPFQLGAVVAIIASVLRFNPPCGCVAFSTA